MPRPGLKGKEKEEAKHSALSGFQLGLLSPPRPQTVRPKHPTAPFLSPSLVLVWCFLSFRGTARWDSGRLPLKPSQDPGCGHPHLLRNLQQALVLTLDRLLSPNHRTAHTWALFRCCPSCTLPGNLRRPRIECSLAGGPRPCHTVNPHRNPSPQDLSLAPKHPLPGVTPRFLATMTAALLVLCTGLWGWAALPRAIPFQDRKN